MGSPAGSAGFDVERVEIGLWDDAGVSLPPGLDVNVGY